MKSVFFSVKNKFLTDSSISSMFQCPYITQNYGRGNRVIFLYKVRDLSKTKLKFGDNCCNNTLILGKDVTLCGSEIIFKGDDSNIIIRESNRNYKLNISICTNSLLYIGKNCYFNSFDNSSACFFIYEHQNIIIGDGCLFSYNVTLRNSDSHLIYDVMSSQRLNHSKSVTIGDHVWVGPNSFILKGSIVGSGAILGANSVVSGKIIKSNTIWAGNPAREIKTNVHWCRKNCNNFTETDSLKFDVLKNKKIGIFAYDEKNTLFRDSVSQAIENLIKNNDKNRFSL